MSHIVTIQTQVRDATAIAAACARLHLAAPVHGTAKLFAGQECSGQLITLPGWRYPVVCDTASGEVQFDNFGGHWGAQKELDQFMQMYTTEKAKLEARRKGHAVNEQQLADGSIRLTILVGGAA